MGRPGRRSCNLDWHLVNGKTQLSVEVSLITVYDVLPTPSNLCVWGCKKTQLTSALCGRVANLEHILSSCPVSLTDGRYTWRHDSVLSVIADTIDKARRKKRTVTKGPKFVNFVKEGELSSRKITDYWHQLVTRQMIADIRGRMQFPTAISSSSPQPDIVIC